MEVEERDTVVEKELRKGIRKGRKERKHENWLVRWWKRLIYEEYHLIIWFVAAKEVDIDGSTSYRRVSKSYKAIKIKKITPKLIKFTDINYRPVEIRSEEPMNWDLTKVY
tara:strand:+ start:70 stop:399 length:330 start_codon:yes stop_codon:yes gene_type:complete